MTPYLDDGDVRLYLGDCLEVMRSLPAESVDAVVTDPPYGLRFMGQAWDAPGIAAAAEFDAERRNGLGPHSASRPGRARPRSSSAFGAAAHQAGAYDFRPPAMRGFAEWCAEWAAEALRVAKPGAHLLAFGGTRTFHRLTCGIEDAGWEIRDCLSWLYGSGFAKSWNFDTRYEEPWCECGDALPYNHATATEHDLRPLRDGDLPSPLDAGRERGEVLLPSLPESGAPSYGAANTEPVDDGRAQPGLEGGPLRGRQGLRPREDAEPPEGAAERLCAGARLGRGGDVGPPAPAGRGGPSHQPRSRGQQAGEPDGLPVAPRALDGRALRDGGRCPRCGQLSQAFRGFGTGLKPSWEPVVVARKPLAGTVAANVLATGCGALNIDGSRVGAGHKNGNGRDGEASAERRYTERGVTDIAALPGPRGGSPAGRWPANVVLDEEAAAMLDAQAGERGGRAPASGPSLREPVGASNAFGARCGLPADRDPAFQGDAGGPSRFFYTAKASTSERDGSTHPTVKPRDLMRWLVRLVTPPGGLVLDPFAGSGTTGLACRDEGLRCILIEREREYAEQAAHRLRQLSLLGGAA